MGTKEPSGARKGRSTSGWVRRMISTAAQTITKASSVPIFTSSARMRSGRNAPMSATQKPVRIVDFQGVRKRLVDGAEKSRRQQAVAGHGQENARLAEHHDQQHRSDAGDGADGDEHLRPGQADLAEGVGHRRVEIDLVVRDHAGEHGGDRECTARCRAPARR